MQRYVSLLLERRAEEGRGREERREGREEKKRKGREEGKEEHDDM